MGSPASGNPLGEIVPVPSIPLAAATMAAVSATAQERTGEQRDGSDGRSAAPPTP
jgi:hypothetical protein